MADIWLMRHAAYEGHRPGYHAPPNAALTPEGHDQIRHALPLPDGITGIVTSPLLRARQTAEALRSLTGLPIVATTDLLAEWHAPTAVHGHTPDTYPPAYRTWRTHRTTYPDLAYEDGESLTTLHTRATHCAHYLRGLTEQRQGPVLAISHKLLLGVLLRLPQGPASFEATVHTPWPFATVKFLPRPSCDGAQR
ncbi:histidine phosphatase family protein [Streptomyces sp. NBC_01803]|uniref:histidine phosphatase family protein n=1 Tax=Streptomyces sp. NBC_01803 TaxID=2975946 RepID=UPI002DD86ACB|nr:histidine phosphatase family protein [Streptomyces sp. NBC_01803]WSA45131.1 histidine phosphatase family protein [Streptomyces sp. NBC_01803]